MHDARGDGVLILAQYYAPEDFKLLNGRACAEARTLRLHRCLDVLGFLSRLNLLEEDHLPEELQTVHVLLRAEKEEQLEIAERSEPAVALNECLPCKIEPLPCGTAVQKLRLLCAFVREHGFQLLAEDVMEEIKLLEKRLGFLDSERAFAVMIGSYCRPEDGKPNLLRAMDSNHLARMVQGMPLR